MHVIKDHVNDVGFQTHDNSGIIQLLQLQFKFIQSKLPEYRPNRLDSTWWTKERSYYPQSECYIEKHDRNKPSTQQQQHLQASWQKETAFKHI